MKHVGERVTYGNRGVKGNLASRRCQEPENGLEVESGLVVSCLASLHLKIGLYRSEKLQLEFVFRIVWSQCLEAV